MAKVVSFSGDCTEFSGQERGGAYLLLLVAAEGGASAQPPISCMPDKINK